MPSITATRRTEAAAAELLRFVERWHGDPVAFVQEALDAEPDPWQAAALRASAAHDRISVRSGHGVGKTTFESWLILWWLSTRFPAKVACTAPTAHQLYDLLWAELAGWHRRMPAALRDSFEWKSDSFTLKAAPQESFAVARTSRPEKPEALQGFHSPNMLFLIDEASGVIETVYEVARGALSTAGAKQVLCGNPTRSSGYFYKTHHEWRAKWQTFRVSSLDSPRVDPGYAEEMAHDYGADSNVYRVRVLGDFPKSDDDGIIPLELIEAAQLRDVTAIDVPPVWGVDVARYGSDRSALAKRQGNVLMEPVKSWQGLDTMQVAGQILQEWFHTETPFKPARICIDTIGIGAGVYDYLRRDSRRLPVMPVNVAESAAMSNRYERLRDELWFLAAEWFKARDCSIPSGCDTLVGELSTVRYAVLPSGKLKAESKDEMKKRGLRSPDEADAFINTFAIKGRPSPVNATGGTFTAQQVGSVWG